jgi:IS30 family transposase
LRRRRKIRQPKGARRYQRVLKPQGPSIDDRPVIVERRNRIGDWESDTVESKDHAPGINTLVERKSGLVFITKLMNKSGGATRVAIIERLTSLPADARRTITFDNGPENRDWRPVATATGADCYFAHPYHSWERGTNENTNGLIRDYFPKGTDFRTISDEEIAYVERELNERPRKRHGWKTPLQVFGGALAG